MKNGKFRHLTLLHLYTDYKITDKPIEDMTVLQYNAMLVILDEIMKYKQDNNPLVVI